jgi:hypothetical protein
MESKQDKDDLKGIFYLVGLVCVLFFIGSMCRGENNSSSRSSSSSGGGYDYDPLEQRREDASFRDRW